MSKLLHKITIIGIICLILISSAFALVFPKETLFFDRLSANDEQVKLINNPEILFTKLGITTKENVTRAKITVQAMPDCPENAPYQNNVLQCFYISMLNINDGNIIKSRISFKVPKEWLKSNDYDENNIELRRYSYSWNDNGKLSQWKKSVIEKEDEDDNYCYFNAAAEGLSYFSIVGVEKTVIETPQNKIVGKAVEEPKEKQKEPVIEVPEPEPKNLFVYLLILILLGYPILLVKYLGNPESTAFEKLTDYIRNSKGPYEDTANALKQAGWEDWQINLGFREARLK